MSRYRAYLPELQTTTLFQGIQDDDIVVLLDALDAEIVIQPKGTPGLPPIDIENGIFCMVLRGQPLDRLAERFNAFDMPRVREPGMLMGEIPALSLMRLSRDPEIRGRGPVVEGSLNPDYDLHLLRLTPEALLVEVDDSVRPAQARMLRNLLGILAQKVTDVRREKARAVDELKTELAAVRSVNASRN